MKKLSFFLFVLAFFGFVGSVSAESINVDFEPTTYSTGSISGQDGWSNAINPVYDQEVVSSPVISGAQSFRMSNAVTSGSFGDWVFSKSLANEAGETVADNEGLSGGTRENKFVASWDFKSADPSVQQTGLQISASPDRGDGARMSFVRMSDTATGLKVEFSDYESGVGFNTRPIAEDLDRNVVHNIRIEMDFVDGLNNDVVRVYVDNVLKVTGKSWENYFNEIESNPTRTVDSMLFQARSGGGTALDTFDKGFLIDNLNLTSYSDDDNDGIADYEDKCLGTTPDDFPQWNKSKGRYMWSGEAWVSSGKGDKNFNPDLAYTYGCSGEQILAILEEATGLSFDGHYKFGVSKSILEEFHNGRYYIETVIVPANSETTVSSAISLVSGKNYVFKASGTANAGDGIDFDVDYSFRIPTSITWTDAVSTYEYLGDTLLDLMVNSGFVNWDNDAVYNPTHTYEYTFVGAGAPATFQVYDVYYPNNTGSLTVNIYAEI